ncbi:MAG: vWA domain-containing protein [Spirochaetaceae bacterium]
MWVFEAPLFLLLLAVVPPAIWFRHIWHGRGSRVPLPIATVPRHRYRSPFHLSNLLQFFSGVLFWLALIVVILALAGPARVTRERVYLTRGMDIMVVLDESPSMAAEDFRPYNRFETAQRVIRSFAESRENDAIGLVTFAGEAALRVPPTLDYPELLRSLEELRIMELGDGTAIGMGIAVAGLHLSRSAASEKVIILITDGVNNSGDIRPETASRVAGELGIKIYAIGIGTDEEVPVEFTDPETGETYRGTVTGGYDPEALKAVADISGGSYFSAGTPGTLENVFRAIDASERVEHRVRTRVVSHPYHRELIFLALGLLTLHLLFKVVILREVL